MDYDVMYNDQVIGNIQSSSDTEATKLAKQIYGDNVTAERTR